MSGNQPGEWIWGQATVLEAKRATYRRVKTRIYY